MGTRLTWWRVILRGAEIFAAAVVLLLLTEIHGSITSNALLLAGLRTDVPSLVAVKIKNGSETTCGGVNRIHVAWIDRPDSAIGQGCGQWADVTVAMPSGSRVALLNNGVVVREQQDVGPLVEFPNIYLRSGPNDISVRRSSDATRNIPDVAGYRITKFAAVPELYPPHWYRVMAPMNMRFLMVAVQKSSQGNYALMEGPPGQMISVPTPKGTKFLTLGEDGFAVMALPESPPPQIQVGGIGLQRHIAIQRDAAGSIRVNGNLCLPKDNALLDWVSKDQVGAPELFRRISGLDVWNFDNGVNDQTIVPGEETPECTSVSFSFVVHRGILYQASGSSSFLHWPGDSLELAGFAGRIRTIWAPQKTSSDKMLWTGDVSRAGRFTLEPLPEQVAPAQRGVANFSSITPTPSNPIAHALHGMFAELPNYIQTILLGLAAALPIGFIFWVIRRTQNDFTDGNLAQRSLAGLIALLALWFAVAAQPLLSATASWIVDFADMRVFFQQWRGGVQVEHQNVYAPIALAAALLIVPVLRAYSTDAVEARHPFSRLFAAVLSVFCLLAGAAVLLAQRAPWAAYGNFGNRLDLLHWFHGLDVVTSLDDVMTMSGVWFVSGFVVLWAPVYWLYRSALPFGKLAGTALGASFVIFYLPSVPYLVEAGRMLFALSFPAITHLFDRPGWGLIPALFGGLLLFVVVVILLAAFREIALSMMHDKFRAASARWLQWKYVLILALLLTLPMLPYCASDPAISASGVVSFLAVFEQFGFLLALLAFVSALYVAEARPDNGRNRFHLTEAELALLAAAFAGYLTLWTKDTLSLLAAAVTGWLAFRYFIVDPQAGSFSVCPTGGLAQRYIAYKERSRLSESRKRSIEDDFSSGKIAMAEYENQCAELAKFNEAGENALGIEPNMAKLQVLGLGPERSPFRNGLRGAVAGLVFASVLQLAPSVFASTTPGNTPVLALVARAILTDPSYSIIARDYFVQSADSIPVPDLLRVVAELADGLLLFTLMGFLFGFAFHRIRGHDGFAKSIVFGLGMTIVFALAEFLSGDIAQAGSLDRLFPVIVFLLILGPLVFDAATVHRQGVSPARLTTIYGVRASVGYASLAGIVASAQPIIQFFTWLFGQH